MKDKLRRKLFCYIPCLVIEILFIPSSIYVCFTQKCVLTFINLINVLNVFVGNIILIKTMCILQNKKLGVPRLHTLIELINYLVFYTFLFTCIIHSIQEFFHPNEVQDPGRLIIIGFFGMACNFIEIITDIIYSQENNFIMFNSYTQRRFSSDHSNSVCITTENETIIVKKKKPKSLFMRFFKHFYSLYWSYPRVVKMLTCGTLHFLCSIIISVYGLFQINKTINKNILNLIDPVSSITMAIILILTKIFPLSNNLITVMEAAPTYLWNDSSITNLINSVDGVKSCHCFHLYSDSNGMIIATIHLVCSKEEHFPLAQKSCEKIFKDLKITNCVIQTEKINNEENDALECQMHCQTSSKNCFPRKCCMIKDI
uniref:Slc30a-2 n=1 Tax=Schmidtea mediterranea TaxID=79327 RepID=A0A0H3YFH9_SCHMD|nr:slc30a-2 [Schmidtea mediterranea]